jgi:hypothetical protein
MLSHSANVTARATLVLFYAMIQRTSAAQAGIAFYIAPGIAVLYSAQHHGL